MLEPKLIIYQITKSFRHQEQETKVFESFSFNVQPDEFISFLGPTGCGKTTLLNLIAGFLKPDAGGILLNNHRIDGADRTRAMIFQDDAVFPWYTTAENIAYGLKIQGMTEKPCQEAVEEMLKEFGLTKERQKYPRQLSGGQRKRVDVARALANSPEILLMDEPFGSLDPVTKDALCGYVSKVLTQRRTTTLLVTHDIEEAIWMSDRVIVLSSGPARVKKEQVVDFRRPRPLDIRYSSEFQSLRKELASQLLT